jgi:hypothetical protein
MDHYINHWATRDKRHRFHLVKSSLIHEARKMITATGVRFRKLCFLLHWGFVESRKLAQRSRTEQHYDLADAFEQIPGFLPEWNEENLDLIRSNLRTYQEKYGSLAFDYLAILEMNDDQFMEVLSSW